MRTFARYFDEMYIICNEIDKINNKITYPITNVNVMSDSGDKGTPCSIRLFLIKSSKINYFHEKIYTYVSNDSHRSLCSRRTSSAIQV